MSELKFNVPKEKIEAFCRRWRIAEFAFFGSVLRDDFRPESDLDVLVTFAPEANWGLLDQVQMQQELELILGRAVDLVSRRALESSTNWIRRQEILHSAQPFYVA